MYAVQTVTDSKWHNVGDKYTNQTEAARDADIFSRHASMREFRVVECHLDDTYTILGYGFDCSPKS